MLTVSPIPISSTSSVRTLHRSTSRFSANSPQSELPSPTALLIPSVERSSYFFTRPSPDQQRFGEQAASATGLGQKPTCTDDVWEVPVIGPTPRTSRTTNASKTGKKEPAQAQIACARVRKVRAKIIDHAEDESLGLEKATARRLDWTPVKSRPTRDMTPSSRPAATTTDNRSGEASFDNVLSAFAYEQGVRDTSTMQDKPQLHPTKRRKLGLVKSAAVVKVSAAATKKPKAIKKKAQTITGLATKEFMPIDEAEKSSLMLSFLSQNPKLNTIDTETEDAWLAKSSEGDGSRTIAQLHSRRRSTGNKISTMPPARAIEATKGQELLFGTSSQLVREDSPSFLRDLQHALKESKASASQTEVEVEELMPIQPSKSMWAAAKRGPDGFLLEAETNHVEKATTITQPKHATGRGAFHASPTLLAPITPLLDTGSTSISEDDSHPLASPHLAVSFGRENPEISLPKSMAEAACRSRPCGKSAAKKSRPRKSTAKPEKDLSNFNNWTVAKLAEQVKRYGFKPVKGKAAMIALLEKCEKESAGTMTLQGNPNSTVQLPHVPILALERQEPEAVPSKPKCPRNSKEIGPKADSESTSVKTKKHGRPRKTAQEDAVPVNMASGHAECTLTGSNAPELMLIEDEPYSMHPVASIVSTASDKGTALHSGTDEHLLAVITKAITTFPPTHDVDNLTWYEKMLMYDPIILEDLTAWLNTEGLSRVGFDEEVWPGLVRSWCEDRSVCCLWKENLRGGRRSRY